MVVTVALSPAKSAVDTKSPFWEKIGRVVHDRASVDLTEDFGDDLRGWTGSGGRLQSWAHDSAGFVRPGRLAICIKSVPLSDYHMEFRGLIVRKSLSFVYRAMDLNNYYAARVTIVKAGPIPEVALERYAVIGGKACSRTHVTLPFPVRLDTLYNVRMDVRGDHFTTYVNDLFVDAFNDGRLPSGGVGFFSAVDESARICWLRITDREDLAGKICLLLAPRFN